MNRTLFVCGTHGDESFSIPVLEELAHELSPEVYGYEFIVANSKAVVQNRRFVDVDMNRVAPGDPASSHYEERRVAEIIAKAHKFDIVVDIHGANSSCGITSLIPLPTSANLALARSMQLERNVVWFSEGSLQKGPLAQHVGRPAIELERGPKADSRIANELKKVLRSFILRKDDSFSDNSGFDPSFYEVVGKLLPSPSLPILTDFAEVIVNDEVFYPYLSSNTYSNIACYKMKSSTHDLLLQKYATLNTVS